MKKQLLSLALLCMGITQAQTWSEDFNSTVGSALPAGWLQNNVDGLTVTPSLDGYNFGNNAWVSFNLGTFYTSYGRCAISTSWYSPTGISNDWLITPSFTVPAGAYLEWEGTCSQALYPDGYLVKISTTGTTVASFSTNLLTVSAENYAPLATLWTSKSISLNTYSTQTVRIAFVNNSNDRNRLNLDNIKVIVPSASDGNVVSITSVPRYTVAGTATIGGVFKNSGTVTANNATMNYQIDNGSVTTETIAVGTLTCLQTTNYSFTANANLTAGTHSVKVWVTQVNGVNETINNNDTAKCMVYVATQTSLMNALIEEWNSSTSPACAQINSSFDPLVNSNLPNTGGRVNVIKYHVNFPSPGNDPSYNLHSNQRTLAYGIGGLVSNLIGGNTEVLTFNQSEINTAKNKPAFANITATLNVAGSSITGSASITPFLTITSGSPIRIHQALVQKEYSFANPSSAQQVFHHAMRQMYPDGNGAAATVSAGITQTVSFSHSVNAVPIFPPLAAQNTNNFWNSSDQSYEYVVFMQDAITGQVLQSGSANFNLVGLVKLSNEERIGVYPNPANDFAVVGIRLNNNSNVDIAIYDVTGKIVYVNKGAMVAQGKQEIRINTSEFANGTYNIIVNTNEGTFTDKLIITKW